MDDPGSPPPAAHPPTDRAGRLLAGRYRLQHPIATGGMAQVWEATDEVLSRQVAVKLLHPHLATDAAFVERFRHEAIAAARLSHPSIVSIYDTVSEPDLEAIVMELVRGTTLRRRLDELRVLETAEVVAIGVQVADALDTAHRAHVVHRDIKPANILLSTDERVLVADFGIAKAFEGADLTVDGAMIGTAKYLAPEQVEGGPVDGRTDLYSLGVVLYEALCGRPPFVADTDTATALARLHQAPLRLRQIRAGVPRPIEDVVLRLLARNPADRYPDAAEFRASLLSAFHGEIPHPPAVVDETTVTDPTVVPRSTTPPAGIPFGAAEAAGPAPPPFRQTERGWLVPTLLILLVAVALGVAGVLFGRTDAAHRLFGSETKTTTTTVAASRTVTIATATPFDPFGSPAGEEDNADAPKAIDGNPDTYWHTETYQVGADITRLKKGVGLSVSTDSSQRLRSLSIDSPSSGWTAVIYVVDGLPPATLEGWGKAVAERRDVSSGRTVVDLGGVTGRSVLVWITRLAPDGQVRIGELSLGS